MTARAFDGLVKANTPKVSKALVNFLRTETEAKGDKVNKYYTHSKNLGMVT